MSGSTLCLLFLLLGLATGALSAWLIAKFKFAAQQLPEGELEAKYVSKPLHEAVENQLLLAHKSLKEKQEEVVLLEKTLAGRERDLLYLEEKMAHWARKKVSIIAWPQL